MTCPQTVPGLLRAGPETRLSRTAIFSSLYSINPINSKKEKSKKQNTDAWDRSDPPAIPEHYGEVCVHTRNQPELLDELRLNIPSLSKEGTPPLCAGQAGAHTPCATAWLVQDASRRCWEAAPPGRSQGGLQRLRARLEAFTHLAVLSSLSLCS